MRLQFLFLLLILAVPTYALGMGPAKRELDFDGSYQGTFTNVVLNNVGQDIYVNITFIGPLAPYVKNAPQEFLLVPDGETREFTFDLDIQDELPPGKQELRVEALEIYQQGSSMIVSRAGIDTLIQFNVPTPGKYIVAAITVPTVQEDDPIVLTIQGTNRGLESIDSIRAEIVIPHKNITLQSDEITNLPTHEHFELVTTLKDPDIRPGEHTVKAYIYYDNKLADIQGLFQVGDLDVEIRSFTQEATTGEINKLSLTSRSLWSDTIENAIASFSLFDAEGTLLAEGSSIERDLDPWKDTQFVLFADFSNADPGTYQATYTVIHSAGERTNTTNFTVRDTEKPSQVDLGIFTVTNLLITTIVLLFLLIILLLFKKPAEK